VGNVAKLEQVLAHPRSPFKGLRPLQLIEQGHTLYANVWKAFLATLTDKVADIDWRHYLATPAVDKAVLYMPGDIPLATASEIDVFVEGCDPTLYDYCLGVTAEPALRAYYPQAEHPGIRMAYFTLRDLQIRHNNLHLVKPLRVGNRDYIERVYRYRYQKEWRNILRLCWELWCTQRGSLRLAASFFCLHMARLLTTYGWQQAFFARPFFLELPVVCSVLSQLLQTRFTTVLTPHGGCALDIDNAEHYAIICKNFHLWQAHQQALTRELKQQA
jgi:hypothetical protein